MTQMTVKPFITEFTEPASPETCPAALLLIDVINDLEFTGGEQLLPAALDMARNLRSLKHRAKLAGIPAIYVNDNFGRWRSDFRCQVEHCLEAGIRGREITEMLHPDTDDYFVLKPAHSGFYASSLEVLLASLKVRTLILTGLAGNICVLYTANDAYMRGFNLIVPPDCTASNDPRLNDQALVQMKTQLRAALIPSPEIDVTRLLQNHEAEGVPTLLIS